jgi:hypothetical protein
MSNAAAVEHWTQMLLSKGKAYAAFCPDRSFGLPIWLLWFF